MNANHHHHHHHHHHNNRNHNHNRLRDRRRNRGRVASPASVEDRAPPLAAGHHIESWGLVDQENRAPAPADIRHVEGWGQVDFGNRVLAEARPVPEDDYDAATFNQSINAEGEADIIRPLITLAVRQMGPSCLFWVSAGPMQAADDPTWIADHHVKAHGDQALARMTVALAVHKWGRGAQISLTARPPSPPPPPDVIPPPPAPQHHYAAPPVAPGVAPHQGEYYYPPPREEYYPPPQEEYYPPPHHYPADPYAPAPYQP
ncbi:uncharacterized protein B0T23DRAFT_234479 [Neurospora hispaniola]|uniref:Uncharacterized protein n=1 Tax=Neurospora hispaniola TaxID=588809 RepID=A0AAJ0MN52_9PEZI|nr:hypothetical protein B0T23DRAFT_234479 [Neurospora hispaniola]